jgi:hypothetical protein
VQAGKDMWTETDIECTEKDSELGREDTGSTERESVIGKERSRQRQGGRFRQGEMVEVRKHT